MTYSWDFGDGTKANGIAVTHTYFRTGIYDLKLTVGSANGTLTITKVIDVVTQPTNYNNPYASEPQNGVPPVNPAVILPTPNNQLSDKVTTTTAAATTALTSTSSTTNSSVGWIIGGLIFTVLLIVGVVLVFVGRRAHV